MARKREKYSDTEHSILYAETGGCCPLCKTPILFKKQNSKQICKSYEIAHIYPLNPTLLQIAALTEYTPPPDFNALDNLIALCPTCHTKYDKDFKIEELLKLRKIKDVYLSETKAKNTVSQYTIQEEVNEILDAISAFSQDEIVLNHSNFDISTVDNKLKTGMSPLQKHEIRFNAITFYVRIRNRIRMLEQKDQASVKMTCPVNSGHSSFKLLLSFCSNELQTLLEKHSRDANVVFGGCKRFRYTPGWKLLLHPLLRNVDDAPVHF